MKILILTIALAVAGLTFTGVAHADRAQFCAGFVEGFKSVKGNRARVPRCPREPRTSRGQTDFRMGITAGIRAAG